MTRSLPHRANVCIGSGCEQLSMIGPAHQIASLGWARLRGYNRGANAIMHWPCCCLLTFAYCPFALVSLPCLIIYCLCIRALAIYSFPRSVQGCRDTEIIVLQRYRKRMRRIDRETERRIDTERETEIQRERDIERVRGREKAADMPPYRDMQK